MNKDYFLKYFKYLVFGVVIGIVLVAILKYFENPKTKFHLDIKKPIYEKESVLVSHVLDGDTIALKDGRKVRLIGIDTPELHHTELPVQFFANEAAEFTKKLCQEGQKVTLEYENEKMDKYDRLLAYVLLPDGTYLNEDLIKRGYAYTYTRFPFSKMDYYLSLEHEARTNQRGMWTHSPIDARVAGIILRYDKLNEKGKDEFDTLLDELIKKYPSKEILGKEKSINAE